MECKCCSCVMEIYFSLSNLRVLSMPFSIFKSISAIHVRFFIMQQNYTQSWLTLTLYSFIKIVNSRSSILVEGGLWWRCAKFFFHFKGREFRRKWNISVWKKTLHNSFEFKTISRHFSLYFISRKFK